MGFKQRKVLGLITSLEDLSIYRFDKIINGDLRYLSRSANLGSLSVGQIYEQAWEKLYNEYVKLTKNNTTLRIYLLIGEINYLTLRYKIVPSLIDTVLSATDEKIFEGCIDEIEMWGFLINKDNPLEDELEKVVKALNNSLTKIKRKKAEYDDLTKKKEVELTIFQQKTKLERILGININVKICSVIEWLAYIDEAKLIMKSKKNNNG